VADPARTATAPRRAIIAVDLRCHPAETSPLFFFSRP
jgi:hypothetical protein